MMKNKKKIKISSLLKKVGFYKTLQVLNSDGEPIYMREFFKEFNKEGYYNQFLRIRKELVTKNIIQIKKSKNGKEMILLTDNGILMKLRMKDIIQQLENDGIELK